MPNKSTQAKRDISDMDAWEQVHTLYERYTQEWLVRRDLRVRALGVQRAVELGIGEHRDKHPKFGTPYFKFTATERNVGTMRELAQAILTACDFVEASNPVWASK